MFYIMCTIYFDTKTHVPHLKKIMNTVGWNALHTSVAKFNHHEF